MVSCDEVIDMSDYSGIEIETNPTFSQTQYLLQISNFQYIS